MILKSQTFFPVKIYIVWYFFYPKGGRKTWIFWWCHFSRRGASLSGRINVFLCVPSSRTKGVCSAPQDRRQGLNERRNRVAVRAMSTWEILRLSSRSALRCFALRSLHPVRLGSYSPTASLCAGCFPCRCHPTFDGSQRRLSVALWPV